MFALHLTVKRIKQKHTEKSVSNPQKLSKAILIKTVKQLLRFL